MRSARMPGATAAALWMLAGVAVVQWWPALPAARDCALLAACGLACGRWPRLRGVALCLLGIAWAAWRGGLALDLRMPRELQWRDFEVTGTVAGLPETRGDATRFVFDAARVRLDGRPERWRGRLRLTWYRSAPGGLRPCSRWHLRLRLHRPRGLLDPGGADGERSALERRVAAVGYVREDPDNRRVAAGWCLDGLRQRLAEGIVRRVVDPHDAALLRALAVGDTRGLTDADWDIARADGVSHLLAISGFHVGIAGLFGLGLVALCYRLWPALGLRLPRRSAQALGALLAAGGYAALAGLGLPTVRALLMVAVIALARCARRTVRGPHTLALALLAVLVVDPLAVLAAGFWLSFAGVGMLMLCLDGRGRGLRGWLRELLWAQLLMSVALLPLTLWFFGQASPVGALANLVAVPCVSLAIVPLLLCGTALLLLAPALAGPWFAASGWLVHGLWALLARMAGWPGAHWYLPEARLWAVLLATAGALWLFAPRGTPLRALGAVLFLPLLLPAPARPAAGGFRAWVLDVGQGLSVIVLTRHHALVYDTGARYPSGYDLGQAVVVPALRALGVSRLDALVVSHADNDHAGGVRGVVGAFPHERRLAGEPGRMPVPMRRCTAGQAWRWDGVQVRVLSPRRGASGPGNDRSCVLLVRGRSGRLLLTGDVGREVEPAIAAALPPGPPLALLVPHHGSRSSSSAAFIHALRPRLALISAGWHNRYGHPHPAVLARYAAAGVPVWTTAASGAIRLDAPADRPPSVTRAWRRVRPRYWRE